MQFKKYQNLFYTFLLLILFFPIKITDACGPTDRSFQGYTFINEDAFHLKKGAAPFLTSFSKLYDAHFKTETEQKQDDNISEWQERFCGAVTPEDLEYIIYQASKADLELLLTAVQSKNMPIPPKFSRNTFAEFVLEKGCSETLEYLIFAKRCEPYVVASNAWANGEKDVSAMRRLVTQGRKELMRSKSPYIRLRYTYQIVRLAHYANDPEMTLEMYDFALPKVDKELSRMSESFLPYWILGHRAGALMALGQNVEASYLYSLIFDNCPSKQHSAFQSFSIKSAEEWKQCLLLCKNDHERATLYAIRANYAKAKSLADMRQIYELQPENANLEVLLLKEMKQFEKNLLGLEFNDKARRNKRIHGIPKPYIEDYLIDFQAFARKVRQEQKVARPDLWHLAEGYLELLAGDFYAARKTFTEVERETNDEDLQKQLETFDLVLEVNELRTINNEVEENLYVILNENETYKAYPDFPDFLRDKLYFLYNKKRRPGKAFLVKNNFAALKPNPKEEILRDLMVMVQSPDLNKFEKTLLTDHEGNPLAYELLDMKATVLMREYQIEAAYEVYKEIPRTQWDNFGIFSPFKQNFGECVHCPRPIDTTAMFNKGEMLEKILDFELKARGKIENNAPYFYQLGLAFYNTSYFGYDWQAMDYFRSGSSWNYLQKVEDDVFPHWQFPYDNFEHTDVTKALYYFEKARLLSLNPELTARATFMAAKCEQKMYFMSDAYRRESGANQIPRLPESYSLNFKRLKEELSETEFYEQIIEECAYFRAYVEK